MSLTRILVVDDEEDILEVCRNILIRLPETCIITERESRKAFESLLNESYDLLITDLKMPGLNGIELLKKAKEIDPALLVLIITGFPTVETAVESVKEGAFDYILKPFSPDQLTIAVRRAIERKRLMNENKFLIHQVEKAYRFDNIIGKSPAMQGIFELIQQVAVSDSDVLLIGESGTGKELIARSIHTHSKRKQNRFVPVDCGAIPEHLLESELFGHEKGAFTGAISSRMGLLEFAHYGTFFLDEICELSISLQAKLLRALQERSFRRVGAKEEVQVNVRVIAATNRNIDTEVKEKRFREDLYYRINVIRIEVPPLRKRVEDIPVLAQHFLNRYAREGEKSIEGIDEETMEVLCRYPWPGNIRELQNVLKRAVTLTNHSLLSIEDLPDGMVTGVGENESPSSFFYIRNQRLGAFEREYLTDLLKRCRGDVTRAASEAQLPRGTLYRFLKKHNLLPEPFRI